MRWCSAVVGGARMDMDMASPSSCWCVVVWLGAAGRAVLMEGWWTVWVSVWGCELGSGTCLKCPACTSHAHTPMMVAHLFSPQVLSSCTLKQLPNGRSVF